MKRAFLAILVLLLFSNFAFSARGLSATGEEIFKSKGCSGCHSPSFDSFAPSLKTISKSYYNNKEALKAFFKGQKPGLIKGEPKTMKGFINITKRLSDQDLDALINYLLSY